MSFKMIRVRLPEDLFMKYKVFCAMSNQSITKQTEHIVREYIKQQNELVKIVKVKND